MARRADRSEKRPTDFLTGASHELRTPLNAVVCMLDLALSEPSMSAMREYLETARESARTLTGMLDDLVDLARDDAGTLEFLTDPCDLCAIVQSLGAAPRGARERLSVRLHPDLPASLLGDERRLRQILLPLADFAMKSADSQQVIVELGLLHAAERSAELELGIGPGGLGTDADRRAMIPFAADAPASYAAAGLGVAIAQRWLRRMRGDLWIDPRPGGPGSFYGRFELACDAAVSQAVRPQRFVPVPHLAKNWNDRPLSILVADDTPANQQVVKAVLTKRGHHVELADNGRQALDRVRHHPFDVVLMDAQMPAMDGLEATSAIRKLPDEVRARVPIIAMTAHVMPEDRRRCLEVGMDDYLPKPLDISALVARVEFHGAAKRSEHAAAEGTHLSASPITADFLSGALARLGGDETLLRELIRMFRQDAWELLDKIRAGITLDDAEAVARNAHNLRGLAANFDATSVMRTTRAIERMAGERHLADAAPLVNELAKDLEVVVTALTDFEETN